MSVLDLGAGTGKNLFEFVRQGVRRAVAVEIDAYASSALLAALARLEDAALVAEQVVEVHKTDARSYCEQVSERYDVVVCYGLLHVFKSQPALDDAAAAIGRCVAPGGHLIVQALTSKYPPPVSQPELEGVILSPEWSASAYAEPTWSADFLDESDIEHSHKGSEKNHRHGSVRAILRKFKDGNE